MRHDESTGSDSKRGHAPRAGDAAVCSRLWSLRRRRWRVVGPRRGWRGRHDTGHCASRTADQGADPSTLPAADGAPDCGTRAGADQCTTCRALARVIRVRAGGDRQHKTKCRSASQTSTHHGDTPPRSIAMLRMRYPNSGNTSDHCPSNVQIPVTAPVQYPNDKTNRRTWLAPSDPRQPGATSASTAAPVRSAIASKSVSKLTILRPFFALLKSQRASSLKGTCPAEGGLINDAVTAIDRRAAIRHDHAYRMRCRTRLLSPRRVGLAPRPRRLGIGGKVPPDIVSAPAGEAPA